MTGFRIEKVSTIDCSDLVDPGDDTHLVAVHGAGLVGWYGPVSAATAALVEGCIGQLAVGSRVVDHDGLAVRLRRELGPQAGALTSWAVGALDCAAWDLHGRAEQRPVAELLGSVPARTDAAAYASWLRLDISDVANGDAIRGLADRGWQFTKWGLRADPRLTADADAERLMKLIQWVSDTAAARSAFDALWTWNSTLTAKMAGIADLTALVWVEEPLADYDQVDYAEVLAGAMPLALGERLTFGDDPTWLLDRQPAAFTPDVVGCGGLTAAVGLVQLARAAGVPVYPHGRSLLPALHLAAAYPDVIPAVEYQVQWEPRRQRLFTDPIEHSTGRIHVPQTPGLGPVPRRS